MLAPCFKTADELGLTPSQRDALIKVLGMLERGELVEVNVGNLVGVVPDNAFTMRSWAHCLCGHARRYAEFDHLTDHGPTGHLFYHCEMNMAQATNALRDYLTGGPDRAAWILRL